MLCMSGWIELWKMLSTCLPSIRIAQQHQQVPCGFCTKELQCSYNRKQHGVCLFSTAYVNDSIISICAMQWVSNMALFHVPNALEKWNDYRMITKHDIDVESCINILIVDIQQHHIECLVILGPPIVEIPIFHSMIYMLQLFIFLPKCL